MGWFAVVAAVIGLISVFVSAGTEKKSADLTQELQEDSQDFNATEAEKSRDWEEFMYNTYYSPEAMQRQYSNIGASESAATMAALGVSPTSSSPATASSGIAGNPLQGSSGLSSLINAFSSAFKTAPEIENIQADTEKTNTENEWLPIMNENTIKATLNDIWYKKEMFGLSEKLFNEVSKPLAQSTIDLNSSEIKKKEKELNVLEQEYLNKKAEFNLIRANTRKVNSEAEGQEFYNQNIQPLEVTEKQSQIRLNNANASLAEEQAWMQNFDNRLSACVGYNVHLPYQSVLGLKFEAVGRDIDRDYLGIDGPRETRLGTAVNSAGDYIAEWFDTAKKTYRALGTSLKYRGYTGKAFNSAKSYLNRWYKGDTNWQRNSAKYFKDAEDWINRNTHYGM